MAESSAKPDEGETPSHGALSQGTRRAALGFIFAAALMDVLALGIVIPVLPNLVKDFTHGDTAQAARYVGWFGLIFGVMQFVFSPVVGALSDRFGRRPVLLVSIFGLGFDYAIMALAPSIGWLFVGRTLSGITAASFSTANAYVADITPPEERAKSFGLMGAAFGVGFVFGPAMGGFLGGVDLRLPFWVSAGLALTNGIYGLFVLPESLPRHRRAAFSPRKANPVGSFLLLRSHPELLALASVVFLYFLAHQVLQSTFVLYTGYRYGWGPSAVGFNLMGVGIGSVLVQGLVVGPFVRHFGERGALYTGLAAGAVGFVGYAIATTGLQFWLALPVFSLMGLVQPGYQGIITRRVAQHEQGRLQGAHSGLMAVAGIVGPVLFTGVFAWSIGGPNVGLGAGTAVYLAAAFMVVALALAMASHRNARGASPV
ncbi:MAG: TCR/Tet family MFS transporter [Polyangiaceae bacterium]|jgi:DHA1 family tetracycline resistance protein-like MFS transporter